VPVVVAVLFELVRDGWLCRSHLHGRRAGHEVYCKKAAPGPLELLRPR
jgi:hypothetical protein